MPRLAVFFGALAFLTVCEVKGEPHAAASPSTPLAAAAHPRLLFAGVDLDAIRRRSANVRLAPYARRVIERATWVLSAPPLIPSVTRRGEPDPAGEQKGDRKSVV